MKIDMRRIRRGDVFCDMGIWTRFMHQTVRVTAPSVRNRFQCDWPGIGGNCGKLKCTIREVSNEQRMQRMLNLMYMIAIAQRFLKGGNFNPFPFIQSARFSQ